jgi:hypothetical protein
MRPPGFSECSQIGRLTTLPPVISAIYVQDRCAAGPAFAPPAPYHGCALPDPGAGIAPARAPIATTSQASDGS